MLWKLTFKHLLSKPFSAVLTLVAVGISLALLGSFWTLVDNLNRTEIRAQNESSEKTLYVFVDSKISKSEVSALKKKLQGHKELQNIGEISAEESLKTLEGQFGPTLTKVFEEDSLPLTLKAALSKNTPLSREETNALFNKIRTYPGVIDLDDGLSTLAGPHRTSTDRILSWAHILFAVVFLAVTLLISHLIRLAFESNRSEIETLKVIGASKSWIFAPILAEALILGFAGSLVGIVFLWAFVRGLVPQYAPLLLPRGVEILSLAPSNLLGLIGIGLAAAIAGSLMTWPLVTKAPQEAA